MKHYLPPSTTILTTINRYEALFTTINHYINHYQPLLTTIYHHQRLY